MEDRNRALREALGRLLAANSSAVVLMEPEAAEFDAAREHAARILVGERACAGRAWNVRTGEHSFLERWRRLKRISQETSS